MRSLSMLAAVLVVQAGCSCGPGPVVPDAGDDDLVPDPLAAPLERLQTESTRPTLFGLRSGAVVVAIGGWPTTGGDRLARAEHFLTAHGELLGLEQPSKLEVRRAATFTMPDGSSAERVVFHRTFAGLPVEGAGLTVLLQGTEVTGLLAQLGGPDGALDTVARVTNEEALALVRTTLGDPAAQEWAAPALVVFDAAIGNPGVTSVPRLAWRLAVGDEAFFVDAHSAELIARRTNIADSLDVTIENELSDFEGTWPISACTSPFICGDEVYQLLHNFAVVYSWWKATFSWISYDDADSSMDVLLKLSVPNYCSSSGDSFKFSQGSGVLDAVGHEFTHSVIRSTSDLVYENEPGAINESFADLFGNLVEGDLPGGDVGEDSGKGTWRNMCQPQLYGDPARYQDYQFVLGDHGGVHSNSGIANKAWCGLTERFFNMGVQPSTSRLQVARLGFTTMLLLNESATFQQLQGAALLAALGTPPVGGALSTDVCAVLDAFDDVGVSASGTALTELCHRPTADRDADGVPDSVDNCPDTKNPTQANGDHDTFGDKCDIDLDNDGVTNGTDLCPHTFDPTNSTWYGHGAVCRNDEDEDGVTAAEDNCDDVANPDQKNTDGDALGDACDPDYDHDGFDDNSDHCATVPSQDNLDSDHDGIGDVCDRCPNAFDDYGGWTSPGPGVPAVEVAPDADRDGVPDACDPAPHGLGDVTGQLAPGAGVVSISTSQPTTTPIFSSLVPCRAPCVWDEDDFFVLEVRDLTPGAQLIVVDDHGRQVAHTDSRGSGRLQFAPRGGVAYRLWLVPPAGGGRVHASVTPTTSARDPRNRLDACTGISELGACALAGDIGVCVNGFCTATRDAGVLDAGVLDAGVLDAGVLDAGVLDAGVLDAGVLDAGLDAGPNFTGCDAPVRAYSSTTTTVADAEVAIDGLGNAILAWRDIGTSGAFPVYAIKVARYTPAGGWGPAVDLLNPARAQVQGPHITVNTAGDAIVYFQEAVSPQAFWVSRWNATSSTWGPLVNVLSNTASSVSYPSVALDGAGNAWATFLQSPVGLGISGVWAARFTSAAGWTTPSRIDAPTSSTTNSMAPVLAVNGAGDGLVAWADNNTSDIRGAFLSPSGTSSAPTLLDDVSASTSTPAVAINAAGVGVVAWVQVVVGSPTRDVGAAFFAAGAVQPSVAVSNAGDGSTASGLRVAIDATGNAVLAWKKATTPFAARATISFHAGTSWTPPAPFDTRGNANTDFIGLALSPAGRGAGVFWDGAVGRVGLLSNGALGTPTQLATGSGPSVAISPSGAALYVYSPAGTGPLGLDAVWCR